MDPEVISHIEKAERYLEQLKLAQQLLAQRRKWIELLTEDLIHLDGVEDYSLRHRRKELINQIQKILDELEA